jgi:hypothetical protein
MGPDQDQESRRPLHLCVGWIAVGENDREDRDSVGCKQVSYHAHKALVIVHMLQYRYAQDQLIGCEQGMAQLIEGLELYSIDVGIDFVDTKSFR